MYTNKNNNNSKSIRNSPSQQQKQEGTLNPFLQLAKKQRTSVPISFNIKNYNNINNTIININNNNDADNTKNTIKDLYTTVNNSNNERDKKVEEINDCAPPTQLLVLQEQNQQQILNINSNKAWGVLIPDNRKYQHIVLSVSVIEFSSNLNSFYSLKERISNFIIQKISNNNKKNNNTNNNDSNIHEYNNMVAVVGTTKITILGDEGLFINKKYIGKDSTVTLNHGDSIRFSVSSDTITLLFLELSGNNAILKEEIIDQNYLIIGSLGEGRFGKVFKVIERSTGKIFAIKEVELESAANRASKSNLDIHQLYHEESMMNQFKHQNSIELYKVIHSNKKINYIIEYANIGTLEDLIKMGPLLEQMVISLTKDLFIFIQYMNFFNGVHRDIKPANLLVSSNCNGNYSLKVGDFGLACIIEGDSKLTQYCGTLRYMSPELLDGSYSKETDIWSIGCTIYKMLSGSEPFYSENERDIKCCISRGDVRFINKVWSKVSSTMIAFIKELLNTDPQKRITVDQILKHKIFSEEHIKSISNELNYPAHLQVHHQVQHQVHHHKY